MMYETPNDQYTHFCDDNERKRKKGEEGKEEEKEAHKGKEQE